MTEAQINILVTMQDKMSKQLDTLEKKVGSFSSGIKGKFSNAMSNIKNLAMGAGVAVFGLASAFGTKLVQTASSSQTKMVQLTTAFEGNKEAAKAAYNELVKFSAKTPYQIGELTDAFVKLKNQGINPTTQLMEAFGNTASAMSKPLNQFIEAVLDASTGEFERLKEFGIKTKSMGDKVEFTFRNVKTNVKNNSTEIVKYLEKLGNTKFAGSMIEQSKTISGTFSTLLDTITGKFLEIDQKAGSSNTIVALITRLDDTIKNMNVQPIIDFMDKLILTFTNISKDPNAKAGVDFLYQSFESIKNTFEGFKRAAQPIIDRFLPPLLKSFEQLKTNVSELSKTFVETGTDKHLEKIGNAIATITTGVAMTGLLLLVETINFFTWALKVNMIAGQEYTNFLNWAGNSIANFTIDSINNFVRFNNFVRNIFGSMQVAITSGLIGSLNSAIDRINFMINSFNFLIRVVKTLPAMSWLPYVPNIPRVSVPQYASGTLSASGLATINERGDEAMKIGQTVYLPQQTRVYNSSDTSKMQANGGNTINLNVVVNNPLNDKKEVTQWARNMQNELKKVLI